MISPGLARKSGMERRGRLGQDWREMASPVAAGKVREGPEWQGRRGLVCIGGASRGAFRMGRFGKARRVVLRQAR